MTSSGYHSSRSTSGVCIHKLAEITGYSLQICRKYLRGEALPDPSKLKDIAARLNVSAGWLLFGEENQTKDHNILHCNIEVLRYLFIQAKTLYDSKLPPEEIAHFLTELLHDLGGMQTNPEQSRKVIEIALASISHFKSIKSPE